MDLTPETPADGICRIADSMYQVRCICGADEHSVIVDVDNNSNEVSVTLYATTTTPYWKEVMPITYDEAWPLLRFKYFVNDVSNRLRVAFSALVFGRVETETTAILSRQQAITLAGVLSRQRESDTQDKRKR